MTPKTFYTTMSRDEVERVCRDARTTFLNFRQIALAGGSVGKLLAERLARASGGLMTEMEILYPERYEDRSSDGQAA